MKRTLLVIAVLVVAACLGRCEAQAIVGKWKMVSSTVYFTPAGAARQGVKSRVNPVPATGSVISEFKSDHTYLTVTSSSTMPNPTTLGGSWSLSGDKLTITVDHKYHPKKEVELTTLTISITGNTMTMTNNIEANEIVNKMSTTAQRI